MTKKIKHSRELLEWIEGSRVSNHKGVPAIVYHGTAGDFHAFDEARVGSRHVDLEVGPAFFFSDDRATANWYAESSGSKADGGGNVRPVYLAMRNPRFVECDGTGIEYFDDEIKRAKLDGNDGVIAFDYDDGGLSTHYVVFRPDQIRSAISPDLAPGAALSADLNAKAAGAYLQRLTAESRVIPAP